MDFSLHAIYKNYSEFREPSLQGLQVKSTQIEPLIAKAQTKGLIRSEVVGQSFLGKNIYSFKIGNGNIRVLAWSQMHGNEATATKCIFDLLNFITHKNFKEPSAQLLSGLELTIIPQLNPDGADAFTRVNAQGIDINRDAYALNSPESKILTGICNELKPDFCFNLHDQRPRYNVGGTAQPATMSFLAPSYNADSEMNDIRLKAAKMVVILEHALAEFLPGKIARYADSFERRAFGDTFQSKGIPTILFEAGGFPGDFEREHVRKIYFLALIRAFDSLVQNDFYQADPDHYFLIPVNEEKMFDWVIRNATIEDKGNTWKSDLGGRREYDGSKYGKGIIEEIGDLSQFFGYDEIDGTDCKVLPGKIEVHEQGAEINIPGLISNGFTGLVSNKKIWELPLPINVHKDLTGSRIMPGRPANLILKRGQKIERVILNGFASRPDVSMPSGYYGISID